MLKKMFLLSSLVSLSISSFAQEPVGVNLRFPSGVSSVTSDAMLPGSVVGQVPLAATASGPSQEDIDNSITFIGTLYNNTGTSYYDSNSPSDYMAIFRSVPLSPITNSKNAAATSGKYDIGYKFTQPYTGDITIDYDFRLTSDDANIQFHIDNATSAGSYSFAVFCGNVSLRNNALYGSALTYLGDLSYPVLSLPRIEKEQTFSVANCAGLYFSLRNNVTLSKGYTNYPWSMSFGLNGITLPSL